MVLALVACVCIFGYFVVFGGDEIMPTEKEIEKLAKKMATLQNRWLYDSIYSDCKSKSANEYLATHILEAIETVESETQNWGEDEAELWEANWKQCCSKFKQELLKSGGDGG